MQTICDITANGLRLKIKTTALKGEQFQHVTDVIYQLNQAAGRLCVTVTVILVKFGGNQSFIDHPFNEAEMTQIACRIVEAYGGHINYFRLMKLLYIIEHQSWKHLSQPAMGGEYFSMHAGPMISEPANAANPKFSDNFKIWGSHLVTVEYKKEGKKVANEIKLTKPAGRDEISDALLEVVDGVIAKTRKWTNPQIENHIHDSKEFPEYKEQPRGSRAPILAEEILQGVGKSPEKIKKIQSESEHWRMFEAALA